MSVRQIKDEWVVVYSKINLLDVFVKSIYSFSHNVNLSFFVSHFEEKSSIKIEDIQVSEQYRNRGFGSIAMEELFKIAKKIKVKRISGSFSHVDRDHIDRLKHFYGKHGFVVNINESSQSESISKELM
ncbi:GNAT family N-acetyltransferase [Paenibacillus sp. JX-17]|uniref:GNAT family N-acetyltransferase n=1 Tax=Paenibacillus lacisoli TaxID=3064525 RepID=A0ABT9CIV9_9BACL|nr:GNAT family N-acetyltransferase [Paenibacillus sp. JX-17]MDO7908815.1 GNAT family N-acetyltransferase [Paenibacillus sp. JX-17]